MNKLCDIVRDEGRTLVLFRAETGDAEELYEAELLCFERDPWSLGVFADSLKNSSCGMYVLYDMQLPKIVAYGVMYSCLDEAEIANIAVLPSERGAGLGGLMLDKMLEIACGAGALSVFLEVRESNAPARGLYLSRGFKEIGKRRRYYRDPCEDAVIMVRKEQ